MLHIGVLPEWKKAFLRGRRRKEGGDEKNAPEKFF
jgi:hypothetical protein